MSRQDKTNTAFPDIKTKATNNGHSLWVNSTFVVGYVFQKCHQSRKKKILIFASKTTTTITKQFQYGKCFLIQCIYPPRPKKPMTIFTNIIGPKLRHRHKMLI